MYDPLTFIKVTRPFREIVRGFSCFSAAADADPIKGVQVRVTETGREEICSCTEFGQDHPG